MKKLLSIVLTLGSLTLASAQLTPIEVVPEPAGKAFEFLTTPSTNWYGVPYGIYGLKNADFGFGVAGVYRINDTVGAMLRLEEFGGSLTMPSASLQLSLPVKLMNRFQSTAFTFAGSAFPLGRQNDPTIAGILGAGWAVQVSSGDKWYLPKDVVVAVEKRTNISGIQLMGGFVWKF